MSEKILSKSGKRSYTPEVYKKMQKRMSKIHKNKKSEKKLSEKKKLSSSKKCTPILISGGKILSRSGKRSYTPAQYAKINARMSSMRKKIKRSPHSRMEHARKFREKKVKK